MTAKRLNLADCRLRPLTALDRDLLLAWRNQDGVRANMFSDHVIGADDHARWFAGALQADDTRHLIFEHRERALGLTSLTGICASPRVCGGGLYVGEADAPRGAGSALLMLTLDLAFGEIGASRLNYEAFAFNDRATRLYQRFGFVEQHRSLRYRSATAQVEAVIHYVRHAQGWSDDRRTLTAALFESAP